MIGLLRPSIRHLCVALLIASCTLPGPGEELSGGDRSGGPEPGVTPSALTPIDPTADYLAITAGVTSVDSAAAYVSPLVLTGPTAFPVIVGPDGRIGAAASRTGTGKVLAFGNDAYMNASVKTNNGTPLVINAIKWMVSTPSPVIGLDSSMGALKTVLTTAGYSTRTVTPSTLGSVNVFITRQAPNYSAADFMALSAFVTNGGGLIYGGQGWSFTGIQTDFIGNRILAGSGIFVTRENYRATAVDTIAAAPPSILLNAWVALSKLTEHATGAAKLTASEQDLSASAVERAVANVPLTVKELWALAPPFVAAVPLVINVATPLVPALNVLGRVAARVQNKLQQELPASEITENVNAADYPGAVPKTAPRETINLTIDGTFVGVDERYSFRGAVWRSTGTYAAPGEVVTVSIPPALAGKGMSAQIGTDIYELWGKTPWLRFPVMRRSYPLTSAVTSIASAFGGLVYITVPPGTAFGDVAVTLTNVVRAPLYVHGKTSLAQWMTIRDYPAPWAEIASDKMIIMVPSSDIRTLAEPDKLMNRWDQIMDADADLAAISHTRVRPERFRVDRQVSAGSQRAGYPIEASTKSGPDLVNVTTIGTTTWGFWHEVGHLHQWQPWVFKGTTEVSVNWFSMYDSEVLFNIPRAKGSTSLLPADRVKRIQAFLASSADYTMLDAWTGLEMFAQLQEWFGWQPFKDVNADYLLLTPASSPSTDQDKIDQWVLRFSQKVGKNLGPFFKTTWRVPVSQSVLDQLALLATWPASTSPIGIELEPNDACAQAQSGTAPVYFGPLTLSSAADVDWFALPAGAADVGKVVHVVTEPGQTTTNTLVEVFTGSCASLTTLGGPSTNLGNHEDWKSTAIPAAGTVYVRVSYSGAFAGSGYNLTITYE